MHLVVGEKDPQGEIVFQAIGDTTIVEWPADPGSSDAGLAPSARKVLAAVSGNEGFFEAFNSYDNAFMSSGIMQWTAGAGGDGELAAMLNRLKTAAPAAFAACFGRYGLDCRGALDGAMTGKLFLEHYLAARGRRPTSTMTDSAGRARRIDRLVEQGVLSARRGSLVDQP